MKKLGQHFLHNAAILEKIVGVLALAEGDRVIEIGPGHGELTAPLAVAARGKHCKIFCIEKDHTLIEGLESFAAEEKNKNDGSSITIIEGDALKALPEIISENILRAGASTKTISYKIVGNIPYYITGKLLRVISELDHKPERVVLLIQKEVAERICAAPPAMNRLAASVQFWADATIVAQVPRKDFSPPPEVDSAVIVLETKSAAQKSIDPALYYRAVREIFAQPRKTLLNNLSSSTGGAAAKAELVAKLKHLGIDAEARAQNLSIEQIIAIANAVTWG